MKDKTYLTVKQLAYRYPGFGTSYIRHLIFNADEMGFRDCVHRINSKIVIDTQKFEAFVDER